MEKYSAIGIMSGTSMDGLDIAFCKFYLEGKRWKFEIKHAETLKYKAKMQLYLSELKNASAAAIVQAHAQYGKYIGEQVNKFNTKYKVKPQFIASHGHTIFHNPKQGYTFQLGSGAAIAAVCKVPVVSDFRSLDVAMGGQGAPLVPIGDKLLFSDYAYCLNLGGFANVSFDNAAKRIAFDICPVNVILNKYAGLAGKPYDDKGLMARKGKVNDELLEKLNTLSYYKKKSGPKSLGIEWVEEFMYPLFSKYKVSVNDMLCTMVEHIAIQIAKSLSNKKTDSVLITGGGAYNTYLTERLKKHSSCKFVLPSKEIIDYKEALIFAFLGVLRWRGEANTLNSVTGADVDSIGGCVYIN